jgi:hypothetical protein
VTEHNDALDRLAVVMKESAEKEREGYRALLTKDRPERFLWQLKNCGLFSPDRIERGANGKAASWPGAYYLSRCAEIALTNKDLGRAIALIVDEFINATPPIENYIVRGEFAEILSKMPIDVLTQRHIDVLSDWLRSGENSSWYVLDAITTHLVDRLLSSEAKQSSNHVFQIFDAATQLKPPFPDSRAKFLCDEYLVDRLLEKLPALCKRAPQKSVELFKEKVVACVAGLKHTYLERAAIEPHEQNREFNDYETVNGLVDALRMCLDAWFLAEPNKAANACKKWFSGKFEILKRFAMYALNTHFRAMHPFVKIDENFARKVLFRFGLLHESYGFLRARFAQLDSAEQTVVFVAIREHTAKDRRGTQLQKDYEELKWLEALESNDASLVARRLSLRKSVPEGTKFEHPDFYAYLRPAQIIDEKSPFDVPTLLRFLGEKTLLEKLNGFRPISNEWDGPTVRGLANALQSAVESEPTEFANELDSLHGIAYAYAYSVVTSYTDLIKKTPCDLEWAKYWPILLKFVTGITNRADFEKEAQVNRRSRDPDAEWLVGNIGVLLRSAFNNDAIDAVVSADQTSLSLDMIEKLLDVIEPAANEKIDNLVTQAINTSRGKLLEALFSLALRCKRKSKLGQEESAIVSKRIRARFDKELRDLGLNFEFQVYCGMYLNQLRYIDESWLDTNWNKLFPREDKVRLRLAIAGLAVTNANRGNYQNLNKIGAIESALGERFRDRNSHLQLVRFVACGYVWGFEPVESPKLAMVFSENTAEDAIAFLNFLANVPTGDLDDPMRQRILDLWRWVVDRYKNDAEGVRRSVFAAVALFIRHVRAADLSGEIKTLVLEVSSDAWYPHNDIFFVPELTRLAPQNDVFVAQCFDRFLASMEKSKWLPTYDYERRYMNLFDHLSLNQIDAQFDADLKNKLANYLRHIPEMRERISGAKSTASG